MKRSEVRRLITYMALCLNCLGYGQDLKRTQNWYFGDSAGLSFATDPPTVLTDGAMYALEGCATISDTVGNLLFYTNGITVWNANHEIMVNGTGLIGWESAAQAALIIPQPGKESLFYIFHLGPMPVFSFDLNYSIVDMTKDSGRGEVTEKNVLLFTNPTEKLAATYHRNGHDIWISTHARESNHLYSFLVTANGVVHCPVISQVGSIMSGPANQTEMRFSPSGKLACISFWSAGFCELLEFNNESGKFTNPIKIITSPGLAPGIIFSIDEKRLLVSAREKWIRSYDISSMDQAMINVNFKTVYVGGDIDCQFAYSSTNSNEIFLNWVGRNYLGKVIFSTTDTSITFIDSAISIAPGTGTYGMPQFVSSYYYQRKLDIHYKSNCWNDSVAFSATSSQSMVLPSWDVYRNSNLLYSNSGETVNYFFQDTGTYMVRLVDNGDTVVKELFIEPHLELGNDTLLCNMAEFNLTIPDNIRCIQWQDASDTDVYQVTQSGTYYVSGYNNRGCLVSDTIRVKMGNILSPVISRSGDSLYSDTGSYTYRWFHNNTVIGSNHPFLRVKQAGNYRVEITDSMGCTATSAIFPVSVLSAEAPENAQVRLFPNPIREGQLLTIDAGEELQSIIIYDVHGKIVYQKSEIGSHTTEIRMSNRGIFFIHVNQTIKAKIIIN